MDTNYDRFYRAMLILVGPGGVKERLGEAYRNEIQYVDVAAVPESMRYELETIADELTKVEPSGERDAIDMSLGEMTEDDVAQLATQVLDMYEEIVQAELP